MTPNTSFSHWHAFSYTGRGYTDSEIRKRAAPAGYPPLVISDYLLRLPYLRPSSGNGVPSAARSCCTFRESQIEEALAWLEKELDANLPLGHESFTVHERVECSRVRMMEEFQRNVVYGYWSTGRQYVSRSLIFCENAACP